MRAVYPGDEARAHELTVKLCGLPKKSKWHGRWACKHRPQPTIAETPSADPDDRQLGWTKRAAPHAHIPEEAWFGQMLSENPDALTVPEIAELAQIRARSTPLLPNG